jgi:hypothetical protein
LPFAQTETQTEIQTEIHTQTKSVYKQSEEMFNGRVNIQNPRPTASGPIDEVKGFGFNQSTVDSQASDAIKGNFLPTPMNQAFFSPANVQIIQNLIRRQVYDRSNGELLIDPQSTDQLLIVMRAMYYQYGKNQPTNIPGQIAELNQIIADWCVPRILSEASFHQTYLHDIQHLPVPLSHPVKMSTAGTKSGVFDRFF